MSDCKHDNLDVKKAQDQPGYPGIYSVDCLDCDTNLVLVKKKDGSFRELKPGELETFSKK